jgi:hypothetical protein
MVLVDRENVMSNLLTLMAESAKHVDTLPVLRVSVAELQAGKRASIAKVRRVEMGFRMLKGGIRIRNSRLWCGESVLEEVRDQGQGMFTL